MRLLHDHTFSAFKLACKQYEFHILKQLLHPTIPLWDSWGRNISKLPPGSSHHLLIPAEERAMDSTGSIELSINDYTPEHVEEIEEETLELHGCGGHVGDVEDPAFFGLEPPKDTSTPKKKRKAATAEREPRKRLCRRRSGRQRWISRAQAFRQRRVAATAPPTPAPATARPTPSAAPAPQPVSERVIITESTSTCGKIMQHRFSLPPGILMNGVLMVGEMKSDISKTLGRISRENSSCIMKVWYMTTFEMLIWENGQRKSRFVDFTSDCLLVDTPLQEGQGTINNSDRVMKSLGVKILRYCKNQNAMYGNGLEFKILAAKV